MANSKDSTEMSGWTGWVAFAAFLAIIAGVFQSIMGLVALFKDEVYVVGPENLWVLDYTTWGWVHLVWGLFLVLVGFALVSGRTWARVVGVILAGLSVIANFAFIPVYPWWSILMIVVGVCVIYALTVHGGEFKE